MPNPEEPLMAAITHLELVWNARALCGAADGNKTWHVADVTCPECLRQIAGLRVFAKQVLDWQIDDRQSPKEK